MPVALNVSSFETFSLFPCLLMNAILMWFNHTRGGLNPILGTFTKLRKPIVSFATSLCTCPSDRMNNTAPTERIFLKFDILLFLEYLLRKLQFHYNMTIITGVWREYLSTVLIFPWIMFRMKKVLENSCRKKSKPFLCWITFFPKTYRLWDNVGKYVRLRQATDDNVTRRILFACWTINATDTRSENVMSIALSRQQ
jgi:hypothetical protein